LALLVVPCPNFVTRATGRFRVTSSILSIPPVGKRQSPQPAKSITFNRSLKLGAYGCKGMSSAGAAVEVRWRLISSGEGIAPSRGHPRRSIVGQTPASCRRLE